MSSPTQVVITSRFGAQPEILTDWYPNDTVYDVLQRAGLEPDYINGVTIGEQYIRGLNTEPVWPGSTVQIDLI